ncbi:hypothetical protein X975_17397, partial [Stegodyphus mimosarum]
MCGSLRTCLHDDVIPDDLPASLHMGSRQQRRAHETVYVPLQILTYMENIDQSISGSALYNIEIALNKVIKYVSEVFQDVQELKRGLNYAQLKVQVFKYQTDF